MMNYQQTLDYLYSQLPMFHRIGAAAYKADLGNIVAMVRRLHNPHLIFPSVHIAGTNGKGSVAHMLASVFQEAGYKTGLCTSPHLKDFRERFRINGEMMPQEFVVDFVNEHKSFFEEIQPSFFEMTIALCFEYFAQEQLDMAIIETGLGGRLDSTNIINPELSVITNIGFDHMQLLGNTLEAIAAEKAGIIKPGIPAVIGKSREEAKKVFQKKAAEVGSELVFTEREYELISAEHTTDEGMPILRLIIRKPSGEKLKVDSGLTGSYQIENICTVVAAVDRINHSGRFNLSEQALLKGIRNVVSNTGFQGRWQVLSTNPLVICDTGHNADGIKAVLENIDRTPHKHLHFVLGMVNDKDVESILQMLPVESTTYYFCKPDVPRGFDSDQLRLLARNMGLNGENYGSVKSALHAAISNAAMDDLVFAGGSTFVVAEVV
jgi:dihydrofolate synthase / folylpolyglutamate synthase